MRNTGILPHFVCFIELEIKLQRGLEYIKPLEFGRISYIVLETLDLGPMGGIPSGRTAMQQFGGDTPGMGDRGRGERKVNVTFSPNFVQGQPCGSHHKSGKNRSRASFFSFGRE